MIWNWTSSYWNWNDIHCSVQNRTYHMPVLPSKTCISQEKGEACEDSIREFHSTAYYNEMQCMQQEVQVKEAWFHHRTWMHLCKRCHAWYIREEIHWRKIMPVRRIMEKLVGFTGSSGYGFPFSLKHLNFYMACKEAMSRLNLLSEKIQSEDANRMRNAQRVLSKS